MYCVHRAGRIPVDDRSKRVGVPQPSQSAAPHRVVTLSQRFSQGCVYPTVPQALLQITSPPGSQLTTPRTGGGSRGAGLFPSASSFNIGGNPASSFNAHSSFNISGPGATPSQPVNGSPPTVYPAHQHHLNQPQGLDITPYYDFVASRKKILYEIAMDNLLESLRSIAPPRLRKKIVNLQQLTSGTMFTNQLSPEGAKHTRIGKRHNSGVGTRVLTNQMGDRELTGDSGDRHYFDRQATEMGASGRSADPMELTNNSLSAIMGTQSCVFDPVPLIHMATAWSTGDSQSPEEVGGVLMALLTEKFGRLFRKVQVREEMHRSAVYKEEVRHFIGVAVELEERNRIAIHQEEQRQYDTLMGKETSDHLATHAVERQGAQTRNLGAVEASMAPQREELQEETEKVLKALDREADEYASTTERQCQSLLTTASVLVSGRVESEHRLQLEERRAARQSVFSSEL